MRLAVGFDSFGDYEAERRCKERCMKCEQEGVNGWWNVGFQSD